MVQVFSDTYEDLTPELLGEGHRRLRQRARRPAPGSQIGRKASSPEGGFTALTDPGLYDGSTLGGWEKRLAEADAKSSAASAAAAVEKKG